MQIPILSGIYADNKSNFRTAYPVNMIPVQKVTGISDGYLRPSDGIELFAVGAGKDRGGINWNGDLYRISGTKLIKVSELGAVSVLGDVGGSGQVSFDYSFDRLAVSSSGKLFYWNGSTLTQVTDTDLGTVKDFIWVDGYFMTTDGDYLIVTELNDPASVNPLKYGSSEADPDKIQGLLKLRGEVYAFNRYTIEAFQNVGGDYFPFQRIQGAQLMRGAIGTHAATVFLESIAFVGGGRNEAPAVWLGANGVTEKISTREIEQVLSAYSEAELSTIVVETRITDGHQFLYLHLPNQTWVYDGSGSLVAKTPVWFKLVSSLTGDSQYKARNFIYCYGKWITGDPSSNKIGTLTYDLSSHYGDPVRWEVNTAILYNNSAGAIFHRLELVCLTGNVQNKTETVNSLLLTQQSNNLDQENNGDIIISENTRLIQFDPTIWTQYSIDGLNWSQERPRTAGMQGQTLKRLTWMQQGIMRNWRIQKFRGTSDAHIAIARIEAQIEALNV